MTRTWRIVAVVAIGWLVLVGVLLKLEFFGLFQPEDLNRWSQPPTPAYVPQTGMDDPATAARAMIDAFMPEEGPACTEAQAEAMAQRVQPMVERACAREF